MIAESSQSSSASDVNTQLLIICCMLLTNHSRVYSVTSLTSQRVIGFIMT